ncbi:MAG: hypothetical protein ACPLTR_12525 [Thermacetogeniaceae bacterium]
MRSSVILAVALTLILLSFLPDHTARTIGFFFLGVWAGNRVLDVVRR